MDCLICSTIEKRKEIEEKSFIHSGGRSKKLRSRSSTKNVITVCGPSRTYCAVHPLKSARGPSVRTRSRATVQGERGGEAGREEGREALAVVATAAPAPPAPPPPPPPPPAVDNEEEETIIFVLTTSIGAVHVVVTRPVAAEAARCVPVPSFSCSSPKSDPESLRQALFAAS